MDTATRIEKALSAQGFLRDGCHSGDVIACIARMCERNPSGQIGSAHIKLTINKDEILRDLEEIQKKAEEVAEAMRMIPWYPPVNIPSIWTGDPIQPGTTTVTYTTTTGHTEE